MFVFLDYDTNFQRNRLFCSPGETSGSFEKTFNELQNGCRSLLGPSVSARGISNPCLSHRLDGPNGALESVLYLMIANLPIFSPIPGASTWKMYTP